MPENSKQKRHRKMALSIAMIIVCACAAIAVVVAYLNAHDSSYRGAPPQQQHHLHQHHSQIMAASNKEAHDSASIARQVLANFNSDQIKETLRIVTKEPHVAGTSANQEVGDKLAEVWRNIGLEDVHFLHYNVLLSYPNYTQPNTVAILDSETGVEVWKSKGVSPVVIPDQQGAPGAGVQWLAYSADTGGEAVVGESVYCHYGTPDDFRQLAAMGISVKGKIAMMRYNTDFRGDKVFNAQQAGAIGAILYSDPAECAKDGTGPANVYPSTVWMPPHGVQRGTIMHELHHGDPLTPKYPAKAELFSTRISVEEARDSMLLPKIPVVPMSYADAYEILSRMEGATAPADWQGGLNFTYHIGPGFGIGTALRLGLRVNSLMEHRPIRDVIGYIHGTEEPDEYVMLGNHYDAWVYGSIDPNSGTAVLAEVARAMLQTANETGWRPRRSIVFLAWDAEEHGLIGSTEFVEEFARQLDGRAVAYFNLDLLSNNQTLDVRTVPTLYQAVVEAAMKVPNPLESERSTGRNTLYDTWLHYFPPNIPWLPTYPRMDIPGGGSDHTAFLNYLGVPVVDFTYRNASWNSYPLYHTLYETPFVNEHLFDTENLAVHKASGQFWAQLALSFADAEIHPLNVSLLAGRLARDYVPELKRAIEAGGSARHSSGHGNAGDELKLAKQQLSYLIAKCRDFVDAAAAFEQEYTARPKAMSEMKRKTGKRMSSSKLSTWQVNARLRGVDRCFINPQGIDPSSPIKRHTLFSLSGKDSYQPSVLASVYDQLENFRESGEAEEKEKYARLVAEEIATVQFGVLCAINEMRPFI